MVRLFTTSYRELRQERAAEYAECLNRNLAESAIDRVLVLAEGADETLRASGRIQTRRIPLRPTYDDFIRWINEVAAPEDVSIIANADIWFDTSLAVAGRALGRREAFALARWDGTRLFDRNDSQDCWIFRGAVNGVAGDFPTGVPRCDNRFLYELQAAGYRVRNPAFSIRAHHVHSGERSEYAHEVLPNSVPGPYRYLWPHNLWSLPGTLWHNTRHGGERIGWRLDRRRLESTLPFRAIARFRGMMAGSRTAGARRP